MEGSSKFGRQRSGSSRGLSYSEDVDRNSRVLRARNIMSSDDNTTQESEFMSRRKGRERSLWSHPTLYRTQVRSSEDTTASVGPMDKTAQSSNVSLRKWLDNPKRKVDALECLHIFSQIVDIVNVAHAQGLMVRYVRPSCFVISSFKHVSFIESASFLDVGSACSEDRSHSRMGDSKGQPMHASEGSNNERTEDNKHYFPMRQILLLESNWYSSPEELSGGTNSCASDIYRLGVLLFELFCTFSSLEEKSTTMTSLKHRVLPPQLLLKWPKEASFCLWLLHPEPSSRPKMSELLRSEFLDEPRDSIEEQEAAMELREKIEEQELLLEFLMMVQQRKQDVADRLQETISFISSDIDEVTNLQMALRAKGGSSLELGKDSTSGSDKVIIFIDEDSGSSLSRKRFRQGRHNNNPEDSDDQADEQSKSEMSSGQQGNVLSRSSRLMNNFRKLESAYLLTRRSSAKPVARPSTRNSLVNSNRRGSTAVTERSSISNLSTKEQYSECGQGGWVNTFLEGLSKYLCYSKLKVKADLKQGDLLNSSNLVCSLSFDRDGEFFATAGVNKKIKVFEYSSIVNEDRDIHYPVVEMKSGSKLSNICWNGYIKSQIASSNFEGVVQVWDVTRSQIFKEMREHERRVWSIDFSVMDPTMLASGSDDGSVKLWNINQGVSVGTIRTKANVCCVQFPMDTAHSLAFGSADHRIYYYDLRNSKMPLCTLVGHNKTVSYVKFIDPSTLVSASTDNTLKLWDLSVCTSGVLEYPVQSFTGHINVKNFVGLSVSEGYIATGSETNEVFVYHKAFPMPALSFKFNVTDSPFADDTDGSAQFISSVCWRGQSTTLVAANSMGNIKLLEMV